MPAVALLLLMFGCGLNPGGDPVVYTGVVRTHAFHHPFCLQINVNDSLLSFFSREQALVAQYRPCKVCKP